MRNPPAFDEMASAFRKEGASATYEDVVARFRAVERDLAPGQEVRVTVQGQRVVQIGLGETTLTFWFDDDTLLVQHYTLVNVLLEAVHLPAGQTPQIVGFLGADEG